MATKKKPGSKADALLEAHIAFITAQISGKALQPWLEEQLDLALKDAAKLKLNDVISAASVKDSITRFAVDMELGSGLPELVGDIARTLFEHDLHEKTRLQDLLSDKQMSEVLDKIFDMRELRERLIRESVGNPIYQALAADIVFFSVRGYLSQSNVGDKIPGAKSMMKLGKSMLNRASPKLEESIEANLRKYIRRNIESILGESERFLLESVDYEKLQDNIMDTWQDTKRLRISTALNYLDSRDVEEAFVMGYEYWKELRKSEYYSALIHAGVDVFFKKYGKTSLAELLEEIGISRDMMLQEAMRYVPPAIEGLKKKKLLEPLIRRNLEAFYHSSTVADILDA